MRNTLNLLVTFSILFVLVTTGCAVKELNPALKAALTIDGLTITGNVSGNLIFAETANSHALYGVYDAITKKSFTVTCSQSDATNDADNFQEGYTIGTTVTMSTEHPGYFSCSYAITRTYN